MYFAFHEQDHKEPSMFKLIVVGEEEKVVGIHILGQGCDEAMQGFAVAVKMGGRRLSYVPHFSISYQTMPYSYERRSRQYCRYSSDIC